MNSMRSNNDKKSQKSFDRPQMTHKRMMAAGTLVKTINNLGHALRVVLHESTNKAFISDNHKGIAVIDIQNY